MSTKQLKIGDPDPGCSRKPSPGRLDISEPTMRFSDCGNYIFVKGRWRKYDASPVVEIDKLFDRYN